VRLEGLGQLKNLMTSSGIEPPANYAKACCHISPKGRHLHVISTKADGIQCIPQQTVVNSLEPEIIVTCIR
jgi:hypothetical protein